MVTEDRLKTYVYSSGSCDVTEILPPWERVRVVIPATDVPGTAEYPEEFIAGSVRTRCNSPSLRRAVTLTRTATNQF